MDLISFGNNNNNNMLDELNSTMTVNTIQGQKDFY